MDNVVMLYVTIVNGLNYDIIANKLNFYEKKKNQRARVFNNFLDVVIGTIDNSLI